MASQTGPRNVVAVLHLSYGSHRDVLGGVFRRAARFGWSVRVVDYGLWRDRATMREILSEWADGVITTGPDEPHVAEWLRGWKGPLVAVGTPIPAGAARATGTAFVGLDETAIARAGADFLLSLGRFRSFGFVRGSDGYAAAKRAEGFVRRIAERGAAAQVFDPDAASCRAEPGPLAEWLASLPAPRAVMVSTDGCATVTLAAAAAARIRVPRDMALVSCDNDETICETSSPTLTSVAPDHARLGEVAAEAMLKILSDPGAPPFSALVESPKIVERQSARPVSPATALAERAERFIRENAAKGAGVADAVSRLGVSRSLAGMRYKAVMGETMRDAVVRRRLEAVQRKLRETDMAIGQIAASCGFRSDAHARRLFRARFGCSMRQWRKNG